MCMHYMLTMDFRKGDSFKRRKNTQEIKCWCRNCRPIRLYMPLGATRKLRPGGLIASSHLAKSTSSGERVQKLPSHYMWHKWTSWHCKESSHRTRVPCLCGSPRAARRAPCTWAVNFYWTAPDNRYLGSWRFQDKSLPQGTHVNNAMTQETIHV